ncbi:MAG: hypothetical protein GX780_07350 [Campylobacteraceae bacterium]|nr:hypothetical protein [Campylobacteraceae bacterium]
MLKNAIKDFKSYIRIHDGYNKPKINFQEMYKLFPDFIFVPKDKFGSYKNFGEAYEQKIYDMEVKTNDGKHVCYMTYREYGDVNENLAYVS